jgi:hypothetical protein
MASKQRPSVLKREREQRKRERQSRKAQKAASKRERRFKREESEAGAPPGDEHLENEAFPDEASAHPDTGRSRKDRRGWTNGERVGVTQNRPALRGPQTGPVRSDRECPASS